MVTGTKRVSLRSPVREYRTPGSVRGLPGNRQFLPRYSSALGRWVNRDPVEERGGNNLYGFVNNNTVLTIDKLGLTFVVIYDYESDDDYIEDGYVTTAFTRSKIKVNLVPKECKKGLTGSDVVIEELATVRIYALGGKTTDDLAHELNHVANHDARVAELQGMPIDGKCVCPECYDALLDHSAYYDMYLEALQGFRDYSFDCNQYPPGPQKDKVCKLARPRSKRFSNGRCLGS